MPFLDISTDPLPARKNEDIDWDKKFVTFPSPDLFDIGIRYPREMMRPRMISERQSIKKGSKLIARIKGWKPTKGE